MFRRNTSAGYAPRRVVAGRRNAARDPGMLPPLPPAVTRTYGATKARRPRMPLATIEHVLSHLIANIQSTLEPPIPTASPVLPRRRFARRPLPDPFILRLDDSPPTSPPDDLGSIPPGSDPPASATTGNTDGITDETVVTHGRQHVAEDDEAVLITLRHARDRRHRLDLETVQALADDGTARVQILHSDVVDELFALCKSTSPSTC
ncbi:hypothetical protein GGI15_001345 [Coemansia interrupta]|uniref:Uncharacterized protein n=1 Tax=Coemansia interrupta TaxID=1126814 RepID=A0A9W8HPG7_9FUNG|nr:hypothetical protein GGI15_001345 [Coemansia interrupta]